MTKKKIKWLAPLTASAFAAMLGITALCTQKTQIYAQENGEREMSAPILIEIADFFEVSIDELLCHTPKSTITTQNASIHLEKIKKNLATLTKEVDSFSQTIKNKK